MIPYVRLILLISLTLLLTQSTYEYNKKNTKKLKVCVIGAGAAGISATRFLADNLNNFEITVFERSSQVGGTWAYTDETGIDKYGYPVHPSMYKNLRTNGPKELMNFPDWPEYKGVNTSSVPHFVVLGYLKNYTDHFQLTRFIKFSTIVTNVQLQKENGLDKWMVTAKNLKTSEVNNFIFDAVIVCNGGLFSPYIPKIPGLKHFKGITLHSHDYRKPECFKNQTVILLGSGDSGIDIGIVRFENGKFILKDNSSVKADALIFCTGYNLKFPFLDSSSGITIYDKDISPLYMRAINIEHPSMSFIGFAQQIGGFHEYFAQAQYVVSFLKGNFKLPPKDAMLEDSKSKMVHGKKAGNYDRWRYLEDLAKLGGFPPVPEYYNIVLKAWINFKKTHLDNFKDYNLVIGDDKKSVKIIKP